jgi:uncharacterized protein (DUF433 family)
VGVSNQDRLLGIGVYTLQEAALYTQIASQKLSRWVFGSSKGEAAFDSQLRDERLISFYDMVQAMAVDRARAKRVSLHKVRQAVERAQAEYDLSMPLAYRHVMYFDGELIIDLPDKRIVGLTGDTHRQNMMRPIVEPFMEHLSFGKGGLVETYTPYQAYGRKIVLNPKRQFGQPIVDGTDYRADVLANAFRIEGSLEAVMDQFNVEADDVNTAVDYMKSIAA